MEWVPQVRCRVHRCPTSQMPPGPRPRSCSGGLAARGGLPPNWQQLIENELAARDKDLPAVTVLRELKEQEELEGRHQAGQGARLPRPVGLAALAMSGSRARGSVGVLWLLQWAQDPNG
jgi:hypothetical protein